MRTRLSSYFITLATPVVLARVWHSLPEDTYAFPKFRVNFLNGQPVLNETAERWLANGLAGGELEFLDRPWKHDDWKIVPASPKEIGPGQSHPQESVPTSQHDQPHHSQSPPLAANYTLEHMRMGPKDSYICLIPKPIEHSNPQPEKEDEEEELTPARSWSLLQPLAGSCLYHRQGWFTYSYCHNEEIRQFKELIQTQNLPSGGRKPEEDPDWESYTLGKAPPTPEPGADLTVAEQNALAANLELARGAGSRYLVQRWGDGTLCDKTGKPREVEVQFHCSMTVTDTILFVKEAKTCSYVVVVHTPRLCGVPGFKSRKDANEEAQIQCREVVDTLPPSVDGIPQADHPLKVHRRKPVLPAPPAAAKDKTTSSAQKAREKMFGDMLRKTIEALMLKEDDLQQGKVVSNEGSNVVVEFPEELDDDDLEEGEERYDTTESAGRLVDALRAAGFNVEAEIVTVGKKDKDKAGDEKSKSQRKGGDGARRDRDRDNNGRDEL